MQFGFETRLQRPVATTTALYLDLTPAKFVRNPLPIGRASIDALLRETAAKFQTYHYAGNTIMDPNLSKLVNLGLASVRRHQRETHKIPEKIATLRPDNSTLSTIDAGNDAISFAHKAIWRGIANQAPLIFDDETFLSHALDGMTSEIIEFYKENKDKNEVMKFAHRCKIIATWGVANCNECADLAFLHLCNTLPAILGRETMVWQAKMPGMDHVVVLAGTREAFLKGDNSNIVVIDPWEVHPRAYTLDDARSITKIDISLFDIESGSYNGIENQLLRVYEHDTWSMFNHVAKAVTFIENMQDQDRITDRTVDYHGQEAQKTGLNRHTLFTGNDCFTRQNYITKYASANDGDGKFRYFEEANKYFSVELNKIARKNKIKIREDSFDFSAIADASRNKNFSPLINLINSEALSKLPSTDLATWVLDFLSLGVNASDKIFSGLIEKLMSEEYIHRDILKFIGCLLENALGSSGVDSAYLKPLLSALEKFAENGSSVVTEIMKSVHPSRALALALAIRNSPLETCLKEVKEFSQEDVYDALLNNDVVLSELICKHISPDSIAIDDHEASRTMTEMAFYERPHLFKIYAKHADIDLNLQLSNGETYLTQSLKDMNLSMINFLLDQPGIDVSVCNDSRENAINLCPELIDEADSEIANELETIDKRIWFHRSHKRYSELKPENTYIESPTDISSESSDIDVEDRTFVAEALQDAVEAQDTEAFERAFKGLQTLNIPISDEVGIFCDAMRDEKGGLHVITSVDFYSKCMNIFGRLADRLTDACKGNSTLQKKLWNQMAENTPKAPR